MSVREEIDELIQEMNPDAMFMDGLDAAIIGIGCQYTGTPLVVYSATKIIQALMEGDEGMDQETAEEHYGFNIACAYIGEGTPIIVEDWIIEENK
jgi:hypothetical protein